ncbi:MAG: asparagine synthase (glutamine-hydrolyzing) [Acidimicrobiales bacterium]
MCGVTGIFERQAGDVDERALNAMTRLLHHRGPDASGVFVDSTRSCGLGHTRLSIIDLAGGAQPMTSANGRFTIVYNGEVYNYRELRQELEAAGQTFRTTSDTEVVLELFARDGVDSLNRLNGIFAFAIHDALNEEVTLVRDHYGVKPLYYFESAQRLLFGSELKSILDHPAVSAELDLDALNSFLTFRYNPSPQSMFSGIAKLYPGHALVVGRQRSDLVHYARRLPVTNMDMTFEEAVEEYDRLLVQAVERQMVADVEVGLLLSGGVDSALIGHMMVAAGQPLKTFTVGFHGQGSFNELADAAESSKYIGSDHHEVVLDRNEAFAFLVSSFGHLEEPIAEDSISPLHFVSELAARHVKVVMSGQGADEPHAGYNRYRGEALMARLGPLLRVLPLQTAASALPRNEPLERLAFARRQSSPAERFLGIYTIFSPEQKQKLVKPELLREMSSADLGIVERLCSDTSGLADSVAKLQFVDTRLNLSDDLLLFNDKIPMMHSLENRVPYLDTELIDFLETVPTQYKLQGRAAKRLQKAAAERWLPEAIVHRPKRGFETPLDELLQRDEFVQRLHELFHQPGSAASQFFNLEYVDELLDQHRRRRRNLRRHLLALLSFELWHRTFFGELPSADVFMLDGPVTSTV